MTDQVPEAGLQEAHWTIHRAFSDYQQISEDRRHLAAEIGELIAGLDRHAEAAALRSGFESAGAVPLQHSRQLSVAMRTCRVAGG